MKWLELKNRGELLGTAQFMTNDVRSDFGGKREGKSHRSEDSNDESIPVNRLGAGVNSGLRVGLSLAQGWCSVEDLVSGFQFVQIQGRLCQPLASRRDTLE